MSDSLSENEQLRWLLKEQEEATREARQDARDKAREEAERYREALVDLALDFHSVSKRPCPTCDPVSKLLGVSIGCKLFRERGVISSDDYRAIRREALAENRCEAREVEEHQERKHAERGES